MNQPPSQLTVALAQINPTVGDIDGNARLIAAAIADARAAGAHVVVLPELSLPGYPAEDLYLKHHFAEANVAALPRLAAEAQGITSLVGFAEPAAGQRSSHRLPDD